MAKNQKKVLGKQFNSVLTEEQYAALRAIAARNQRTAAGQIRAWIEQEMRKEKEDQSHAAAA